MRSRALRLAAIYLTGLLLMLVVACSSDSDPDDGYDRATVAANWADASADLSLYCLRQSADGSGDSSEADTAVTRLVNIASAHADETYSIDDVPYRDALSAKASDLQDCDAALAARLDLALADLE